MPQPVSQATHSGSSKHALFLTLLGLVLTTLGLVALVELLPRPSVSASSPFDPEYILESRFTVTNDGYLDITNVQAVCFINLAVNPTGGTLKNSVFGVSGNYLNMINGSVLRPSQSFTVPCLDPGVLMPTIGADIAIVVYYRPWPFVFWHSRRFFRFVSRHTSKSVTWDKQPSDSAIENGFDKSINPDLKNELEFPSRH